jgi:hypothetical protein
MWFQGPPKAEPLNHTPIPHVNSLPSKLMDGKIAGLTARFDTLLFVLMCQNATKSA